MTPRDDISDTGPPTGHATGSTALALGPSGAKSAAQGETGTASCGGKGIGEGKGHERCIVCRVDLPTVLGLGDLVGLVVFDVGAVGVVLLVGVYGRGGGCVGVGGG